MQQVIPISDLNDGRISSYRDIRHQNLISASGKFIVESRLLVDRLIESDHRVESILIDGQADKIQASWLNCGCPIYTVADASELLGYQFHRGVVACGIRKKLRDATQWFDSNSIANAQTSNALYLHRVHDPENMGGILRSSAALGVRDVILGPACVDPYARRVMRVSMGTTLKLNLWSDRSTCDLIDRLKTTVVTSIAATLSKKATSLRDACPNKNWLLLLGNEANGLPVEISSRCDLEVCIPMKIGVDSLNVSSAAAILIYALTRAA